MPAPRSEHLNTLPLRWGFLHLYGLCGFGIAQPLFQILERNAAFFVVRRSSPIDIWLLAIALVLPVPLAASGLEWLLQLVSRRGGRVLRLILIFALTVLALSPTARLISADSWVPLALALIAAVATMLYAQFAWARSFLSVLALAPVLFLGLFLSSAEIRPLLFEEQGQGLPSYAIETETPLVLLILDELPLASLLTPDHEIDERLFPNFASLASSSLWFRNATASQHVTMLAVPTMLTGRLAHGKRDAQAGRAAMPNFADHPNNLFTLLAETHELSEYETLTQLCPPVLARLTKRRPDLAERLSELYSDLSTVWLHAVLPKAWTERLQLPQVNETWGQFARSNNPTHADRAQVFREFVEGIRVDSPGGRPGFHFLHITLPHRPWTYFPSGETHPDPALGRAGGSWSEDSAQAQLGLQMYMLQLGFVDSLIGELIAALKESGLWETAVVVLAADHGVAFTPGHHLRKPNEATQDGILPVPFFVRLPLASGVARRNGEVDDRNVQMVDLLPTLCAALGIECPWECDGTNALGSSAMPPGKQHIGLAGTISAQAPAAFEIVEQNLALFGGSPTWNDLYALGPARGLLGRDVTDVTRSFPGQVSFAVNWSRFEVDPAQASEQTLVRGRLFSADDQPPPKTYALAVNGKVRAVFPGYRGPNGGSFFAGLIPAVALRAGLNQMELFAVIGGNDLERIGSR